MEMLDKKVSIPSYLHELHGKQASVFDLLVVYAAAILSTAIMLYLVWDLAFPTYKMIILAVLALDLAGGVVSNLTEGTNTYYMEKPKRRYVFIGLHVVQPAILIWLFPSDVLAISMISLYTLTAMAVINSMTDHVRQRVSGSFLMAIGLSITFIVGIIQPIVHLMLVLFVIKLIVAFAVRWK